MSGGTRHREDSARHERAAHAALERALAAEDEPAAMIEYQRAHAEFAAAQLAATRHLDEQLARIASVLDLAVARGW